MMTKKTPAHIILASVSPRRSDLLREFGIPFTAVAPKAPEITQKEFPLKTPREIAIINAVAKARAVAREHPKKWVLGADTVVVHEHKLFGKPANEREARKMLRDLSGMEHEVITGVALVQFRENQFQQTDFWVITKVTFHPLSAERIAAYLSRVDVMDKAGAYAIQEEGDTIVKEIDGSRYNVMGLPIERLLDEIDKLGIFKK